VTLRHLLKLSSKLTNDIFHPRLRQLDQSFSAVINLQSIYQQLFIYARDGVITSLPILKALILTSHHTCYHSLCDLCFNENVLEDFVTNLTFNNKHSAHGLQLFT